MFLKVRKLIYLYFVFCINTGLLPLEISKPVKWSSLKWQFYKFFTMKSIAGNCIISHKFRKYVKWYLHPWITVLLTNVSDSQLIKKSVASYGPPCLQEVAISACAKSKCHVMSPVLTQLNPSHCYLGSNN